VRVVAGIGRDSARREAIERRLGEVEMPAPDEFGHFLEEEGHQSVAICAPSTSASVMMITRS
jgi:hypothetical protein